MKITQLIDRFIAEMNGTPQMVGIKPLGESHYFALRRLQREQIAQKTAVELKKQDVIDYARMRRTKVQPCTINQELTYLRGVLKYAESAWEDGDVSDKAIRNALPMLIKLQLIGKANRRTQRPTDEQIQRIKAWFDQQATHPKMKLKRMADLIEFAIRSSRRRGELCRMTHGDVDYEKHIYWVRDVKHPTKKKGNDKAFILWPELEEIIRRQPRLSSEPSERIWPYHAASVTQAYIRCKKALGIKDIRFHDNRGRAISDWLLKGLPPEDVSRAISGHSDTRILETVYDRRSPSEILQAKYLSLMQRPT